VYLLMADKNPMGARRIVPLGLPHRHTAILRDELDGWIAGIEEDVADPRGLPDRDSAIREAEAFGRLLAALTTGEIALPDEEARAAMARAAEGYDEAAGYERAVAVHEAHHAMLAILVGEEG
jgi:hypothetical protein